MDRDHEAFEKRGHRESVAMWHVGNRATAVTAPGGCAAAAETAVLGLATPVGAIFPSRFRAQFPFSSTSTYTLLSVYYILYPDIPTPTTRTN